MDQKAAREVYHHGDLRAALLKAAEQELAEKGVEGFTLRGCAKRAGVSHAAPAHHFGDADGLLTALAAEGFGRFLAAMRSRQAEAAETGVPASPLDASGLGYVDFALANTALFRLMFSSARPDFSNAALHRAAQAAFSVLESGVETERGASPWADEAGAADVAAAWAMAHGMADLIVSGRLDFLATGAKAERDRAVLAAMTRLALPPAPAAAQGAPQRMPECG